MGNVESRWQLNQQINLAGDTCPMSIPRQSGIVTPEAVCYCLAVTKLMKYTLLTLIVTSLLATTALADPIHDAANTGDIGDVQAELDAGVDVNAKAERGRAPLHDAAASGHMEVAELLITNGANLNAKSVIGETPLDAAVNFKQTDSQRL